MNRMFGFGHKRSRISRSVARRAPETIWTRIRGTIRNRGLLGRLSLCFLAMVLLAVALQSWRAPFPFRRGDYVPHGIAAKISFERVDEKETDRARDRAEEQVPFVFRNDPARLQLLPEEFRAALAEIAQTETLDDVDPAVRRDFGLYAEEDLLDLPTNAQLTYLASDPVKRFNALRQSIDGPNMMMGRQRIEEMVDDFSKFIAPLQAQGVIDLEDVRRQRIGPHQQILVVPESSELEEGRRVLLSQLRLDFQLSEAGALGTSWLSYPSLRPEIHGAVSHWLARRVEPTMHYDQVATKEAIRLARERVPDRMERFIEGDLLVRPRNTIEAEQLSLLEDEYAAAEQVITLGSRIARMSIVFGMILILSVVNGYYIISNEPRLARGLKRLLIYLSAIVLTAAFGRLLSFDPLRAEIIPLMATVLVISLAYNQFLGALTAFSLSLILTLATTTRLDHFVILVSTCGAAIIPLGRVASRSTLIRVSFLAAFTYFLISCGLAVICNQTLGELVNNGAMLSQTLKGAAWCLVAGYLVAGSLPIVESTFGVVTDISLLELSDPSHPLLQDLVSAAPGTYNHSIAVASIAEAAAEAVGGNGLLVRVGAYFHDIGKMLKPQYFIENVQAGMESRHIHLNPAMSTLIIIGHVKDGVDLAEQYNLPPSIIDFIEQHHGTTLVEYFYREAAKQAEDRPDHKTDAEESSFRYPGPKPQTKEAGVLMIADACESACRTLTEPTPKRIESLVHNLVMRRLLDGQFDECSLKMSEIRQIEQSVVKSLIGVYHGRIRYPEAKSEAKTA